jgi:hypothetical protein
MLLLLDLIKYPSPILKEPILSMLKFAGLNQITPITNIDEQNVLDDLKEKSSPEELLSKIRDKNLVYCFTMRLLAICLPSATRE